jgi:hypothetical protein
MQIDLFDVAAVAGAALILVLAFVFIAMIWAAALGSPVF